MSETATSTEATTDGEAVAVDPLDTPSIIGDAKTEPADASKSDEQSDGAVGATKDAEKSEGEDDKDDGKPVAGSPEAYDLKMPEGVTLDADAWKVAEPAFRDANLGPEQAQKLAEAFPSISQSIVDRVQKAQLEQVVTIRKEWADQVKAEQGAAYDANLAVVAKARDAFMRPEDTKFLADTGLGNSPMMFNLLLKVGKAISEGSIDVGQGAPPASQRTAAEKMYGEGWGPRA